MLVRNDATLCEQRGYVLPPRRFLHLVNDLTHLVFEDELSKVVMQFVECAFAGERQRHLALSPGSDTTTVGEVYELLNPQHDDMLFEVQFFGCGLVAGFVDAYDERTRVP